MNINRSPLAAHRERIYRWDITEHRGRIGAHTSVALSDIHLVTTERLLDGLLGLVCYFVDHSDDRSTKTHLIKTGEHWSLAVGCNANLAEPAVTELETWLDRFGELIDSLDTDRSASEMR